MSVRVQLKLSSTCQSLKTQKMPSSVGIIQTFCQWLTIIYSLTIAFKAFAKELTLWTPEAATELEDFKKLMRKEIVRVQLQIYTDASVTEGFGFISVQLQSNEQTGMVLACSTSCTPAQSLYSGYELKLVGVVFAV